MGRSSCPIYCAQVGMHRGLRAGANEWRPYGSLPTVPLNGKAFHASPLRGILKKRTLDSSTSFWYDVR